MNRAETVRLFHTVRHLRPLQVASRLRLHLPRARPRNRAGLPLRAQGGRWQRPVPRARSLLAPQLFVFLGIEGELARIGWDDPETPRLWRYNLHYFDDLNARDADRRRSWHEALISRWISENPEGRGTGWEPYPTSLRIVNWIKYALAGNRLADEALASLATQARWLAGRLETHLMGNHLLANAKALVFAGAFFEGDEADRWRRKGAEVLRRELVEQVLPDGGHFERSPMYHALVLEDLLDLDNLRIAYPGCVRREASASARIAGMRRWLAAMSHPDGRIAFFNDAAFDVAAAPADLEAYARRLGHAAALSIRGPVQHMQESGYVRVTVGDATAPIDVAPIGPDYLPGHAHADTLSFELSIGAERLLVNSGTSTYETGAERDRQRGTAAHNTVAVDGADSSQVWAGFRVARRARPRRLSIRQDDDGVAVGCAHDGYAHLPGRPLHRRLWRFGAEDLVVEDRVRAQRRNPPAVAFFHFHPAVALDGLEGSGGATLPGGRRIEWAIEHGEGVVEPSTWHPRFGASLASQRLVVRLVEGRSTVRFRWP